MAPGNAVRTVFDQRFPIANEAENRSEARSFAADHGFGLGAVLGTHLIEHAVAALSALGDKPGGVNDERVNSVAEVVEGEQSVLEVAAIV